VPLTERLNQSRESANASIENGPLEATDKAGEDGEDDDDDDDVDDDDGLIDTGGNAMQTFQERLDDDIDLIKDFLNGLEYQRQFGDHRFLDSLERNGAAFFRFARNCLDRERRLNSSRAPSPTTWEQTTANAMFYRSRPRSADRDT
jgi:hypothetical protein